MNKKGGAGLIIGIIIGIIVIAGIITVVIIFNSKGFFKPSENEKIKTIALYVVPRDSVTLQPVEANYILEYKNKNNERVEVSKGKLDPVLTELQVPSEYMLTFYCWNKDHYLVKAMKLPATKEELKLNKSTFSCDMVKMDNATISNYGDLNKSNNEIELNISDSNWFYRAGLCFAWTNGIIDVSLKDQFIKCDKGNWTSFASYDKNSKTLVNNDSYFCEDNSTLENCEFVEGSKCKLKSDNIPSRFKGKVDSCVDTGQSFFNSSIILDLEVKTGEYKNSLDGIIIYLYDYDRRFNEKSQIWEWVSEINGQDIALPDQIYQINYNGECNENSCSI